MNFTNREEKNTRVANLENVTSFFESAALRINDNLKESGRIIMNENGKPINKASEVKEFAGKIVCFQVKKFGYILLQNTQWPKPKGWEGLNFGYIPKNVSEWQEGGSGYNMAIFKGKKEVASKCALLDQYIRQDGLSMREATPEEIAVLRKAYEAKEGRFEYRGWPNSTE